MATTRREGAFLAGDGIDHRHWCGIQRGLEGRNAEGRIGRFIERMPALDGVLADRQRDACVAGAGRDIGQGCDLGLVGHGFHGFRGQRGRHVAFAQRDQHFRNAGRGSAGIAFGDLARLAHVCEGFSQPCLGELAIIDGLIFRRGQIRAARLVAVACGFRHAALPIGDAGTRDRRLGALCGMVKMGCRARGIVEEAQRDPPGVEFGLDILLATGGAMLRA